MIRTSEPFGAVVSACSHSRQCSPSSLLRGGMTSVSDSVDGGRPFYKGSTRQMGFGSYQTAWRWRRIPAKTTGRVILHYRKMSG